MDSVEALTRLGGVARARDIVAMSSRKRLRRAVAVGTIRRRARDRYALANVDLALDTAASLSGVLSHLSAALHWGWAVKHPPPGPHVALPRGRKLRSEVEAEVHWLRLRDGDVDGLATSRVRTIIDCARDLPGDEALAVIDSALRSREVTKAVMERAAADVHGAGAARVRRLVAQGDARAENPFESVLRWLALQAGLDVVPQLGVEARGWIAHPDLVDRRRRLVLEADSFTHHSHRAAFKADCERYNALSLSGWTVLRLTWEHVMLQQADVLDLLREAAGRGPRRRTEVA